MQTGRPGQAHELLLDLFNNVEPTPPQIRLTALAASAAGDPGDAYYYMAQYDLAGGNLPLANQQLELALAAPEPLHYAARALSCAAGGSARLAARAAGVAPHGRQPLIHALTPDLLDCRSMNRVSCAFCWWRGCSAWPAAPACPPAPSPIRAIASSAPTARSTNSTRGRSRRSCGPPRARYVKVIPQGARTSITNFMTNLTYTTTIINDFLQGQWRTGASDTARLVVNTLFGLGGLFDVATPSGLDRTTPTSARRSADGACTAGLTSCCRSSGPRPCATRSALLADEYTTPRAYICRSLDALADLHGRSGRPPRASARSGQVHRSELRSLRIRA